MNYHGCGKCFYPSTNYKLNEHFDGCPVPNDPENSRWIDADGLPKPPRHLDSVKIEDGVVTVDLATFEFKYRECKFVSTKLLTIVDDDGKAYLSVVNLAQVKNEKLGIIIGTIVKSLKDTFHWDGSRNRREKSVLICDRTKAGYTFTMKARGESKTLGKVDLSGNIVMQLELIAKTKHGSLENPDCNASVSLKMYVMPFEDGQKGQRGWKTIEYKADEDHKFWHKGQKFEIANVGQVLKAMDDL